MSVGAPETQTAQDVIRVAAPVPLRDLFDYLLPAGGPRASVGARVKIPFGQRKIVGVIVDVAATSEVSPGALKPALEVIDSNSLLPETLRALCLWSADYYQHPIGEVFAAAFPPALRDGKDLPLSALRLTTEGLGLPPDGLKRAPSQNKALAMLQQEPVDRQALRAAGISAATLRELSQKQLIEPCPPTPRQVDDPLRESGPHLDQEQADVVDSVTDSLGAYTTHLLEGITGSGKTEVYLRCIEACLKRGEQALVMVPEIGLTPQTLGRFKSRFAVPIAILHSGLAEGQRLAAWQAAQSGSAGIIIGTRSAIFTPLAKPGLIIVDEEHDASYKQQDGFRYSARDVAVKRAQLESCPVVLGSATPSLESLHNAQQGRYRYSTLSRRQGGGRLPTIQSIDLRGKALNAGISDALLNAIQETVNRSQKQVLLFLNRRGYAPTLQCHDCGWIAECDQCDARLTLHLRKRKLRCHHCSATRPLPHHCPKCNQQSLLTHGLGTEQAETYLTSALSCPVHRVDSDAMRGREAMNTLLDIANSGEPCVILGTQMLTKGHHFPAVELVGVVDTDALLFSADFRGEERMAQLVIQVAGRAGRESAGGKVLLQTHHPQEPLLQSLMAGEYTPVASALLEQRKQRGLPPAGHLILLRTDSRDERDGERFIQQLRKLLGNSFADAVQIIGPLPSAMPRRAGRFRWQLWCLSRSRSDARRAAALLTQQASTIKRPRDLKWFLDIDPLDVG